MANTSSAKKAVRKIERLSKLDLSLKDEIELLKRMLSE